MPPRREDDTGRFTSSLDADSVLAYLHDHDRPSERTASSVAGHFDVDRSTAYRHLEALVEDGRVERDDLGKNVVYLPAESP